MTLIDWFIVGLIMFAAVFQPLLHIHSQLKRIADELEKQRMQR